MVMVKKNFLKMASDEDEAGIVCQELQRRRKLRGCWEEGSDKEDNWPQANQTVL